MKDILNISTVTSIFIVSLIGIDTINHLSIPSQLWQYLTVIIIHAIIQILICILHIKLYALIDDHEQQLDNNEQQSTDDKKDLSI